jgi:CBS domain-containing protein
MGRGPLFKIGAIDFGIPHAIPFYALLGLVSGLSAVALSRALYWIEDQFERLPLDEMWWPAIGGLGLGLIGLVFPRALGVGYGTISDILSGRFALEMLLLIIVFKSLALLISLGSGTSGGLLAPMFLIGAAIGGSFASIINLIFPAAHLSPGAFALASMAATFGAASRATFTFIIFAFEITRDYDSVLPLMIASVIADGIALVLMKHSIMTEKLARRGLRVHQEYEPDILQQVTVAEVMDRTPPTVPPQMRLSELARMIGSGDASLSKHQALPIVDEERRLLGIITRGDILRAVSERDPEKTTVLEAGSTDLVVAYEDETVHEAVAKMLRHNIGRLPVVSRSQPDILTGYIGRAEVLKARLYKLHEEHVRQPGWIRRRLYLRALARAARARR